MTFVGDFKGGEGMLNLFKLIEDSLVVFDEIYELRECVLLVAVVCHFVEEILENSEDVCFKEFDVDVECADDTVIITVHQTEYLLMQKLSEIISQ